MNFRRSGATPPKPRGTVKFVNLPSGKSNTPGAFSRPHAAVTANIREDWSAGKKPSRELHPVTSVGLSYC